MTDQTCYSKDRVRAGKTVQKDRYAEAVWWAIHHSSEASRMACMLHCYLDESGTDAGSPVAVLGGLILQQDMFFWLDVEWKRVLECHSIQPPIHMKEFGPDQRFGYLEHSKKRALFTDLVTIINEHKEATVAATINPKEHQACMLQILNKRDLSVYGDCFLLLCVFLNKCALDGNYQDEIPIVVDEGNDHRHFILEAHSVIRTRFQPEHRLKAVGGLTFDSDTKLRPLQAADMIAWAVRRRISGLNFNNGAEPLERIFEGRHYEQPYQEEWMRQVVVEAQSTMKSS